jgi:hypothetical protein
MTNRQPIPMDALLVAIDIAKVRNEVLIEAPNHKRWRRLSVLNARAEHDRLMLRAFGKPVICAFEATGNYHRPIAWRLIEPGFDVRLVSSMALARCQIASNRDPSFASKSDPSGMTSCGLSTECIGGSRDRRRTAMRAAGGGGRGRCLCTTWISPGGGLGEGLVSFGF